MKSKYIKNPICIDCNIKLSSHYAKRCKSCETKKRKPWLIVHPDTRLKQSLAHLGEKNASWKGNNACYERIHIWLRSKILKPKLCQKCHIKPSIDLASINHTYKRDDLSSWIWVCRKCHMIMDNRYKKFLKISKKLQMGPRKPNGQFTKIK